MFFILKKTKFFKFFFSFLILFFLFPHFSFSEAKEKINLNEKVTKNIQKVKTQPKKKNEKITKIKRKTKNNNPNHLIVGEKRFYKILESYKRKKNLKITFEKETYFSFLEKNKRYYGELFLSKEKVRIETRKPQKSLLIYDGKNIWWEENLPKELGGNIRVIRAKADTHYKKFHILFTLFSNSSPSKKSPKEELNPLNIFQILNYKLESNMEFFTIKLNHPGLNISEFSLSFNRRKNRITRISYKDELENKVTYIFKKTFFNKNLKKKFNYQPPKKAEVIEY